MKFLFALLLITFIATGVIGDRFYSQLLTQLDKVKLANTANNPIKPKAVPDKLFGWKFPVAKFPKTGSEPNLIDKLLAYSDIRDPGGIPRGLPMRLKIPVIGVDSAIEDAYITPDGRMDVPAGTVNVAWFALGPHPGREGSAVIGGHFGFYEENKGPTVFYNLDKLKAGDKVYIVDDQGNTLAFVVRSIKLFDRNADSTSVFTSSDGLAHLNLITCEGVWNQVNDSYPDRRVVFTDAIPSEGAVTIAKPTPIVAKAKFTTKITPTATPTQIPTPTMVPTSTLTPIPTETVITPIAIKNVYAAPIDGLITFILFSSIVFVVFKIISR